jgi:hypothetical protein
MEALSPEVLEDLRHGRATLERKIAVCSGAAHLAPADHVEILAVLSSDADERVSQRAAEGLASQPAEAFVEAIRRPHAIPPLFAYASANLADKPAICEALVQNKNCGAEYLVPVVPRLGTLGVQSLMENLERVAESPALIAALQRNTSLTAEHKNLLQELLGSSIDEGVLAEAALEAEPDAARRQTLLQRLATMSVSQRVQFAVKGGSEARRTLIRDSNKVVQRAVLQSPRLTDQEVENFATMTSLTDEILRLIANNRNFRKNYSVVRNLLNNSKTPLDVSLHMLPMLNPMDLKKLTTNKNVPETLRTTALKLQKQRQEFKKS